MRFGSTVSLPVGTPAYTYGCRFPYIGRGNQHVFVAVSLFIAAVEYVAVADFSG